MGVEGGAWVQRTTPNLLKGPLKRSTFSHKLGPKWGFCRGVKGGEVQKVHFLGPKGLLFGGFRTSPIRSWLWACILLCIEAFFFL